MAQKNVNKTRAEYLEHILGDVEIGSEKHQKAFEQSLNIRKFEIELYWKRAAYFWTFISVAFAGYFALTTVEPRNFISEFLMSCVGLVFSIAWYCVNRGSKAWQRNWEAHLDLLEDEMTGPLYKTMVNRYSQKFWNLTDAYFFSPTRINHLLNIFLILVWVVIAVQTIANYFDANLSIYTAVSVVVITVLTIASFFGGGKTSDEQSKVKTINYTVREYNADTNEG